MTIYLTGASLENSRLEFLMKITFLGDVEITVKSGVKSRFGTTDF